MYYDNSYCTPSVSVQFDTLEILYSQVIDCIDSVMAICAQAKLCTLCTLFP